MGQGLEDLMLSVLEKRPQTCMQVWLEPRRGQEAVVQEQPAARRGRHPLWSLLDSPCTPGINDWVASCQGGSFQFSISSPV